MKVAEQREVGSINDMEVLILALHAEQRLGYLRRTLTAILGKRPTDHRQLAVFLLTRLFHKMLPDISNYRFDVLEIAVGSLLVALTLMPDEHLDVVVRWQVVQTVVNLSGESFQ